MVFSDPCFFLSRSNMKDDITIPTAFLNTLFTYSNGSIFRIICYTLPLQAWLFNNGESPKSTHTILIHCHNIMMPRNAWQKFPLVGKTLQSMMNNKLSRQRFRRSIDCNQVIKIKLATAKHNLYISDQLVGLYSIYYGLSWFILG